MVASRKQNAWDRRLKEIEREKSAVRMQLEEVRRWAESVPDAAQMLQQPRLRDEAVPARAGHPGRPFHRTGVAELESVAAPENEASLDFTPGPEGLDTKRVVMPRLQRTDLLRPAIGGAASPGRLVEPEHDRFRNYFGSAGLKRVREARQEKGSQRIRTIFMICMVVTLGFILLKMVT